MTTHIRHRRSTIAGAALPGLPMEVGELALNLPDIQVFMGAGGAPQPVLAVRRFASTAKYATDDVIVYAGAIYRAKAAVGPKAFDPNDWVLLTQTTSALVPMPDGTAALPGLPFAADVDTGLYRPGADALGISTSGAARGIFDTSGLLLPNAMKVRGSGSASGSWAVWPAVSTGGLRLDGQGTSGATIDLNTLHDDALGTATIRFFRSTNTAGQRLVQVLRGDGTATVDHQLKSGGAGVTANLSMNGGRTVIGTSVDNGLGVLQVPAPVHIGGSGYAAGLGVRVGAAYGGTGYYAAAGGIVLDSNAATGISILTPNNVQGKIVFGDSDSSAQGHITYDHNNDTFILSTANAGRMVLSSTFNQSLPAQFLTPAGTLALPSYSFTGRQDAGLWMPSTTQIGVVVTGADVMRMQNVTGDMRVLVADTAAKWSATGRGVVEVGGATTSAFGLNIASAQAGSLIATGNSVDIVTAAAKPTPITFKPGAVETVRVPVGTDAQLFLGTAGATLSAAGRALININGATSSFVEFDVGGAIGGYVGCSATLFNLAATTTIPIGFVTGGVEKMRLTAAPQAELLVGAPTPYGSQAGRGNITINGTTDALVAFQIGGAAKGYLFAQSTGMTLSGEVVGNPVNLAIASVAKLSVFNTVLMDAINNQELGWRDIPAVAAPNQAMTAAARGMVVPLSLTPYTIPTGMPANSTVCLVNTSGAQIQLTGFAGLHLAGGTLTGNRILAPWGFATVWYQSGTVAYIMGNVT